jgi:hypothetical protein
MINEVERSGTVGNGEGLRCHDDGLWVGSPFAFLDQRYRPCPQRYSSLDSVNIFINVKFNLIMKIIVV